MADTLDQATLYRNQALAKKNKSANRIPATTILAKVVSFLNDENLDFLAVEDVMPTGTKHTAIVNRFKTVIVENKLDGLVYPIVADDHVLLINLVESDAEENDQ
jgi:hypothetical protein